MRHRGNKSRCRRGRPPQVARRMKEGTRNDAAENQKTWKSVCTRAKSSSPWKPETYRNKWLLMPSHFVMAPCQLAGPSEGMAIFSWLNCRGRPLGEQGVCGLEEGSISRQGGSQDSMILTDREIQKLLKSGLISIEPKPPLDASTPQRLTLPLILLFEYFERLRQAYN